MQTFLPEDTFEKSAAALDNRRLGKQRVEAMQILSALTGYRFDNEQGRVVKFNPKGWVNHPATKMWKGHEQQLARYGITVCDEWISRGFNDSCKGKIQVILESYLNSHGLTDPEIPWYTEELISSHRAALLYKDFDQYSKRGWSETPSYDYVWPVE